LRDLGNRKIKNILNLEINELTADIAKGISVLLGAFNFFSFRFPFFFDPALLGSRDKIAEML
jgi:hypothetical protein